MTYGICVVIEDPTSELRYMTKNRAVRVATKTLCGRPINDPTLIERAYTAFIDEFVSLKEKRCKDCMDHPDYPLHVLGTYKSEDV